MIRLSYVAASALALLVAACADSSAPPTVPPSSGSLADRSSGAPAIADADDRDDDGRVVRMRDACDPTTFNAALQDPNACVGKRGNHRWIGRAQEAPNSVEILRVAKRAHEQQS